jgi:peptide/nickel transport system permease protein
MTRSILRRLALIALGAALANFLSFAYAHFALPHHIAQNPFSRQLLEQEPLFTAYFSYLGGIARGDLGSLPSAGGEVLDVLWNAAGASFGLLIIALVISMFLGLILGMRAAKHEPARVSSWLTITSTVGLAMPSFYIGMIFIIGSILYAINSEPGTTPPFPLQGFGWDAHMVFPIIVLSARPTMEIAMITANAMVNELNKQYVVSARAMGNSWRGVRWRHVFRNILSTLVVSISRSFRLLVGELILVEFLFSWPGLGRLLARTLTPSQLTNSLGATFLNAPLVAGTITMFTILFLITDTIANLAIESVDPRLEQAIEGTNG